MTDYGLPHEVTDVTLSNLGHGFYFSPFGEVVNFYDDELNLSLSLREWSNYAYPLLHKWPRVGNRSKFFSKLLRFVGESLASVTFPRETCRIRSHG